MSATVLRSSQAETDLIEQFVYYGELENVELAERFLTEEKRCRDSFLDPTREDDRTADMGQAAREPSLHPHGRSFGGGAWTRSAVEQLGLQ